MPLVCALVPVYKAAVARLIKPEYRERPLIVADTLERGHAIAVDDGAYELGARNGMTLVQATACAREAAVVVDDPVRNRELWERALDALDAASPLVEDAGEGIAFLEMRGVPGSQPHWLVAVRDAFAGDAELSTLPLHVALGPNKFVTHTAARVRDGVIVRQGEERSFVAPLPLRFLELDPATIERLELLGVSNLRTLAALPHGPFVRRFGPQAARWHALAGGIDDRPLVPRARRMTIDRSLFGEGTAEREDQLLFALRTLVVQISEDVFLAGKGCGALRLDIECEDGECCRLETTLAQPTSQAETMFDVVRARLEGVVLHSPVTGLRLTAERLEEAGTEVSLFAGSDPSPEIVGVALARLEAALGPNSALRARIAPGNRYEARVAYEPFTAGGVVRPVANVATSLAAASPVAVANVGTLAYRVLPPRTIDVRVRRGRPAFVGPYAVLDIAGPWRVDEAWWAEAIDTGGRPIASDAYDVLLEDGTLCRIVSERSAWYLCGTYD